jgi:hypothetical protein
MIATSRSTGVSSILGVTLIRLFKPALMKPVCSATPRPSIATSTTPSGGKSVNVFTIFERKPASASPLSWLFTWMGAEEMISPASPRFTERGSMSVNCTGASTAESTQVSSSARTKSTAGSGSLLPAHSIQLSARWEKVGGAPGVLSVDAMMTMVMVSFAGGRSMRGPGRRSNARFSPCRRSDVGGRQKQQAATPAYGLSIPRKKSSGAPAGRLVT